MHDFKGEYAPNSNSVGAIRASADPSELAQS